MAKPIEIELLPELAALAENSIKARALLREAVDHGGNLATLEIDRAATFAAGHIVVRCKPTDRLRRVVSAMRAINGVSDVS